MSSRQKRKLIAPLKKKAGRSRSGRITVRHRGGGVKRHYRKVSFGQEFIDTEGEVLDIEYDPNRSADIALVSYQGGKLGYMLAPQEIKKGDKVIVARKAETVPGNRMELRNIPVGTSVYNIALQPDGKGKLVRSAGSSAIVLAQEGGFTHLRMPSREVRKVVDRCFASIGEVSRSEHRYRRIGKAGTKRKMGRRPTVRGSAMNPVDHPHGGGEGRSPIGMPSPKTPSGKKARGVRTRKRKHTDRYILQKRRKKKGKK